MLRVNQIKLSIDEDLSNINKKIEKKLNIKPEELISFNIFKESIDARKGTINFVYTIDVEVKNESKVLSRNKDVTKTPDFSYKEVEEGNLESKNRPVIIGTGPAGIFAGLILSKRGYNPILLERGRDVASRTRDVEEFWKTGKLNTESNVQFGEGGAGTFSDGKLTTRIKDKRCRKVLEEFVLAGAPEEILYSYKPHIGTDILKKVVKNVRDTIESLGGEIRFDSKVTDFFIESGKITGLEINDSETLKADEVILAIGHSARDTYEVLNERGVQIRQKPFSIGVRIEHPQSLINESQYGKYKDHERLGAADYRLTYQASNNRAAYTFCMCPGGEVVAAASEENMLATNGMSKYKRNKDNANSALLIQVNTEDFGSEDVLAGMEFQRKWERIAFEVGGNNYNAPVQLVGDFLNDTKSEKLGSVVPSYRPDIELTDLRKCLPEFVVETMKEAITEMDKKLKGFAKEDAILIGVETRSSAPIRIEREEESLESLNTEGLFPCGEGGGYAGGIISGAVDGIKVAEKIIGKYKSVNDDYSNLKSSKC